MIVFEGLVLICLVIGLLILSNIAHYVRSMDGGMATISEQLERIEKACQSIEIDAGDIRENAEKMALNT